jgi:hypothetical protein
MSRQATPKPKTCLACFCTITKAVTGEKQTNWRQILVRLREATTGDKEGGREDNPVVCFSTEIALVLGLQTDRCQSAIDQTTIIAPIRNLDHYFRFILCR